MSKKSAEYKSVAQDDDEDADPKPHRLSRTWDVKTSRKGFGLNLIQKRRRISLDVIRPSENGPVNRSLLHGESAGEHPDDDVLFLGDKVVLRVLKASHDEDKDDDTSDEEDDDDSVSTIGDHGDDPGWTETRRQRLEGVEIMEDRGKGLMSHKFHQDVVNVKLGKGNETKARQFHFSTKEDALSFRSVLENLKTLAGDRAKKQIVEYRSSKQPAQKSRDLVGGGEEEDVDIKLLIEVVSAIDLPAADGSTSDAHCIIQMGGREIHRTDQISNTLDPIWTVKTGSLCLLSATPEEFFNATSGLNFIVKDYDAASKDDTLGTVNIEQQEILKGTGKRIEYDLVPRHPQEKKSKLVLRYRRATPKDEAFMAMIQKSRNKPGAFANDSYVQPKAHKAFGMMKRESRKGSDGTLEYRVKPGPDPKRTEETTWMSEAKINKESFKQSHTWIEAGSGKLGRLYLEVLGCDGLPNKDSGTLGGKTDSFASVVYEDCIVNTEVINDSSSPRWMPWSQRAFVLNMMHPSSQVFVGLFDYDSKSVVDPHDPIARVTIDTTNFRPRNEYILHYDLYTSALVTKRKNYGAVTIRLRMEWNDQRKVLMSPLSLRAQQYVNVVSRNDKAMAFYTVNGKYDVNQFDTDIISSYVDELKAYESVIEIVQEAVATVLLWRGHSPLSFRVLRCPPDRSEDGFWNRVTKSTTVLLPLHSAIAFCGGVLLVENFDLFPSFCLFAIAWFFLSTMGYKRNRPSPWHRCPSYLEIFRAFVLHLYPPKAIHPDENIEAIKEYDENLERKLERKKKEQERKEKEAEEAAAEEEEVEEVDESKILSTPQKGFSVNPLKPILFPIQQNLGQLCVGLRIVKSVVTWEESYQAFWIVSACVFLGIPLLFVPWAFLVRWLLRITVWTFLGPWMKLVDIFYIKRNQGEDYDEEAKEKRKEELKAKYKEKLMAVSHSQIKKEEALKLRDMRKFMFGNHIVRVPQFKEARHFDYPLSKSSATPYVTGQCEEDVVDRKIGQYLVGDMILSSEEHEPDEKSSLRGNKTPDYGATKSD